MNDEKQGQGAGDRLVLEFGAMADSLRDQLISQGWTAPREALIELQRDANAIVRLLIRGILTRSQGMAAERRLVKRLRWHAVRCPDKGTGPSIPHTKPKERSND